MHGVEERRFVRRQIVQRVRALNRRGVARNGRQEPEILAGVRFLETFPRFLRERQLRRALETEHRDGVGVSQVVGDLAALEEHVQRHHGRARLQDAEVHHRKIRQVRTTQRDLVARLDARAPETVRDLVRQRIHLRIGEPQVVEDNRFLVGPTLRAVRESHRKIQHSP